MLLFSYPVDQYFNIAKLSLVPGIESGTNKALK